MRSILSSPYPWLWLWLRLCMCKCVCTTYDHHQHHFSAHLLQSNPFAANAKQHSMMWIVMNHERFMVLIIDVIVANNRKLFVHTHTQPPLGSCCCAEQCAMLCYAMLCTELYCTVVCILYTMFSSTFHDCMWMLCMAKALRVRTSYTHVRLGTSLSTTE